MKRAFTMVEIVITLVIIGIILSLVWGMGQGFSNRVRFANLKEELSASVNNVIQEAATTSAVFITSGTWHTYGKITLQILSWNKIERTYSSGQLLTGITRTTIIPARGVVTTSGFTAVLTPYAIGCTLLSGSTFSLRSADMPTLRACYTTNADTCKVREVKCP